ncbi:hypothetical protein PCE1_001898 [Barthelona sp. PCE]
MDILNIESSCINYCNRCEQAKKGPGCVGIKEENPETIFGVCGKTNIVSTRIDMINYFLNKYAEAMQGNTSKVSDASIRAILVAGFSTITNTNFDADRLRLYAISVMDACNADFGTSHVYPEDEAKCIQDNGYIHLLRERGEVLGGLIIYVEQGAYGSMAYAEHAVMESGTTEHIREHVITLMDCFYQSKQATDVPTMLGVMAAAGAANLTITQQLDDANFKSHGQQTFSHAELIPEAGKACIIVSGHSLSDIKSLLEYIKEHNYEINVATHGEMRRSHGQEELRALGLKHHFGSSWSKQRSEFKNVPAAILFTTNCIVKPLPSYADRVFTCNMVAMPGCEHIENRNWESICQKALELGGFTAEDVARYEEKYASAGQNNKLLFGGGYRTVLEHAGKIVDLIKRGVIKRAIFIGGCESSTRTTYYKELGENIPKDWLVLTAGCGSFLVNNNPALYGDFEGIPRVVDVGQCNDVFGAVQIALALQGALGGIPFDSFLSFSVSWFEGKALAWSLTLLAHLGIPLITLGPSLPRFLAPAVIDFLVENLKVSVIGDPKTDVETIISRM